MSKSENYLKEETFKPLIDKILDGVLDPEGISDVYELEVVLERGNFDIDGTIKRLIDNILNHTNDPDAIDAVYALEKEIKKGQKLMPLREKMVMEQLENISPNIDIYINDQYTNEFLFDYNLVAFPEDEISHEDSKRLNNLLTDVASKMEFETLHPTGASGGSDYPYTCFVVKLHSEDRKVVEEAKMYHEAVQEKLKEINMKDKTQADHGPEGDKKFMQEAVAKAIEKLSPYKTEIYEEELTVWPDGRIQEYGTVAIYLKGVTDIGSHYAGVYSSGYFDDAFPDKEIADVEIFVTKDGEVEDQNPGGPSDIDFGINALISRIDGVYKYDTEVNAMPSNSKLERFVLVEVVGESGNDTKQHTYEVPVKDFNVDSLEAAEQHAIENYASNYDEAMGTPVATLSTNGRWYLENDLQTGIAHLFPIEGKTTIEEIAEFIAQDEDLLNEWGDVDLSETTKVFSKTQDEPVAEFASIDLNDFIKGYKSLASIAPYFANNPDFKDADNFLRFMPENNKKLADRQSKDYLDEISDQGLDSFDDDSFETYNEEYKDQMDELDDEDGFDINDFSDEELEDLDEEDLIFLMDEGEIELDIDENEDYDEEGEAISEASNKYYKGLSKEEKEKRKKQFDKRKDMSDSDPDAYKPFSTDKGKETKPSKHTKKYQEMYGEEAEADYDDKCYADFSKSDCKVEGGKIKGLQKKADDSGISYSILKQVYNRGMAAWKTGHRPGATQHQWAFARVNSFITGGKTRYTADKDLWEKHKKKKKKKSKSEANLEMPKDIIAIYDNRGTENETLDCMTFVLDYIEGPNGELGCLGTSYNGVAFSQFSMCHDGPHLGNKVEWEDIDEGLKKHVINRMKEDE